MNLTEEFARRREERLRKKWNLWQPRNPNPSDLTDCPRRYQVMRVLCWESRPLPDLDGMEAMEDGEIAEGTVIRQMQDEGWDIVQQQGPFEIRQPLGNGGIQQVILTGKIDGKIRLSKAHLVPFEVKNTSDWTFGKLETEQDLQDSPWTRKWWRQVEVYCLGENSERAVLIVAHRGKRKLIEVELDYEKTEQILADCVWAVDTIQKLRTWETPPDDVDRALLETYGEGYPDDFNICRICWCRDVCCFPPQPDTSRAQVRNDLEPLIERYLEAKPHASEYEKLRKEIKVQTEGFPQTVAGAYVIDGEVKIRRMSAKPARGAYVSESWAFEVRKVGQP